MFTGLIQQVCTVKTLAATTGGAALTVDLHQLAAQTRISDSIAVNGVCLTVAKLAGPLATFDLSSETLAKTNLGKLSPGSKVNVELALKADDRFAGHFVLGHIDGTATIRKVETKGSFANIIFAAPKELLNRMIPKGSVAVDGISLTIAELNTEGFTVAVIPETLKKTTLASAKQNDTVNIEIDIITKTVVKHLGKLTGINSGLTIEKLRQQGF